MSSLGSMPVCTHGYMETGKPVVSIISKKESWCVCLHMALTGSKQIKAWQPFETVVCSLILFEP